MLVNTIQWCCVLQGAESPEGPLLSGEVAQCSGGLSPDRIQDAKLLLIYLFKRRRYNTKMHLLSLFHPSFPLAL